MSDILALPDNRAYPVPERSTAARQEDRRAEDLQFGAVEAYEQLTRGGLAGQDIIGALAKHYDVTEAEILRAWNLHYGPEGRRRLGEMLEGKRDRFA